MAPYVLLPMLARTAAETVDGDAFPTCGRTNWKAKLRIGHLEDGGSVTIVLDGSPDGDDDTWSEIGTFGARAAAGEFGLDSGDDGAAEITLTTHLRFIRARRTDQVGDAVYEVVVDAAFMTYSDGDLEELLGKRVREHTQGLPRLMLQAESDVLELLRPDPDTGAFAVDCTSPLFYDAVRRAIAGQVEHLMEIDRLRIMKDPSAKKSLRSLGRYGPGVKDMLRGFMTAADLTWRHR